MVQLAPAAGSDSGGHANPMICYDTGQDIIKGLIFQGQYIDNIGTLTVISTCEL
jgi:hypothetical protein